MKTALRTLALGTLIPFMVVPANSSAKDKHYDPYVQGPDGESGLIREVRHRLVMLPHYGVFDDIGFTVNGATVTLVGQVRQPVLKTDADTTVSKIEAVTNVVNNIEVLPLSPEDDRVRRDVYRAVLGAAGIGDRYGFSAAPRFTSSLRTETFGWKVSWQTSSIAILSISRRKVCPAHSASRTTCRSKRRNRSLASSESPKPKSPRVEFVYSA